MNTVRTISVIAAGLAALGFGVPATGAAPRIEPQAPALVQTVAEDCYAIGQQVAAQQGGQLARANSRNRGGQEVCEIVVLVPGRNGERPRREVVVVPRG